MINKKGMELPVNIVVMIIIGLILFGIGMNLFSKIYSSSESEVEDLNNRIKSSIKSLECPGDDWICTPSNVIKNGDRSSFDVYVANKGESDADFSISIDTVTSDGDEVIQNSCGELILFYATSTIEVRSGESAAFPFTVIGTRVLETPCSFVTTARTEYMGSEKTTPLIVRVE